MKTINSLKQLTLMFAVFALMIIAGCSNDEMNPAGNSNNISDNLTLSVMSDGSVSDDNEIIITEAKCLIGKVELETEPSSTSIYLPLNPFVVNLNSFSSAQLIASVNIPQGTFNKIKFQIHKPEDNETPPDPEFKTGESGNQRFSVIIKGTYNGNSFIYRSGKSVNLVFSLNNLLTVGETYRNLTFLINPSQWFTNNNTTIDPRNSSFEDIIDDNIKNSFKRIFRDDDRDGRPDDN